MADNRKTFKIKSDQVGDVRIADEVVAIIAGLATTEVEGVSSMAGNITNEIVSKLGMKNLSKGILVEVMENEVKVDVAINIAYGYSIPDVSAKVQDKVKSAIENMTGLTVAVVHGRRARVGRTDGESRGIYSTIMIPLAAMMIVGDAYGDRKDVQMWTSFLES